MAKDEKREVHLELLLGKRVVDRDGKAIGRIEEVRAEQQGDELIVTEYLVGRSAALERLSARGIVRLLLGAFGAKAGGGYKVSWNKLDLSNVDQPCLRCAREELEAPIV